MKLLAFMLLALLGGPLVSVLFLWWIGRQAANEVPDVPSAAPAPVPGAIPDVPGLTRVENQWFYDVEVPLDGYHFYKCRFDQCVLLPGQGLSQLTLCVFTDTALGAPEAATTLWGGPVGVA